jgi:anhydro-N-acetylmuramic acid kinase
MARLGNLLSPVTVDSSAHHGIDPMQVEAAAFAWLARQAVLGKHGNLPAVTGARGARVLGAIYPP